MIDMIGEEKIDTPPPLECSKSAHKRNKIGEEKGGGVSILRQQIMSIVSPALF